MTRRAARRAGLLAGLLMVLLIGCTTAGPPADDGAFTDRAGAAVTAVLADLEDYWTATQPALGGPAFDPPTGGYHPVDTSASGTGALCAGPAQLTGNAFYCPDQDGLVWDGSALVPALWDRGGAGAVAAAFAHEYGHAIQARIGPTPAQRSADPAGYPTLLVEAQADCYAGAFLAWLAGGGSTRERLDPADLLPAVQLLLDFRDPAGMPALDPAAHGRGVDRLAFLVRGLRSGAPGCHTMTTADLPLDRRTESGGAARFPDIAAAAADAAPSLRALAGPGGPGAADPNDLAVAASYGQFAAAAAGAVATGRAVTGTADGAACFAGAWTAAVTADPTAGGLGAWAGDPDEALDLVRYRPGATFDQLAAFVDGWTGGAAGCR